MNKVKHIFFDMDGVILNSEPLHYEAKLELLKQYGIDTPCDLNSYVGISNLIFWREMINKYDLDSSPEELEVQQINIIINLIEKYKIEASNGLYELINTLNTLGIEMSIVSSSPMQLVDSVLRYLNIKSNFKHIVTGNTLIKLKPNPDLYLLALKKCNINAYQAVAIEDSRSGVQAATSAGIDCIGYNNPTSGNQDLSKSKYQVENLKDIICLIS